MKKDNRYIVWVDHARNLGAYVRLPQNLATKWFPKARYRTKSATMEAAREWRDQICDKHGITKADYRRRNKGHKMLNSSRNSSGVIGLRRMDYIARGNRRNYAWVATYMHHGKQVSRYFAIRRYGEKGAFMMACRERYKHVGTLSLTRYLKDLPARPDVPFIKVLARSN